MGLLVEGKALSPEETEKKVKYIKEHGITQFILIWNRVKDLEGDELRFGDEIECGIFFLDKANKSVKLSVRSADVKTYYTAKFMLCNHN
jgi:glutamate--cysteine ligase catalytic subunit